MTGDSVKYKYINNNSPEEKINYSYSEYRGEAFLSTYRESREKIISQVNIYNDTLLTEVGCGETEKLFISWISKLKENNEIELEQLNLLLKRFEVTKKIYENYNIDFRPTNKSKFKNYRLYVLYAYVLSTAYSKYKKIQYLNSLLKVNDINISIWTYLDEETKKLFAICLQSELDFINNLDKKLK